MFVHRPRELAKSLVVCGIVALASVAVALADGVVALPGSDDVALTDDDGGAPLFVVPALAPGQRVQRCVRIAYRGSADASVRMTATATGSLADDLQVSVRRGSGGGSGSCDGFSGSEIYDGSFASLETAAPWQAPAGASEATYRVDVSMAADAPPGARTAQARFAWQATDTGPPPPEPSPTPEPTATPGPTPKPKKPAPPPRTDPDREPDVTPGAGHSDPGAAPVAPLGPEGAVRPDDVYADPQGEANDAGPNAADEDGKATPPEGDEDGKATEGDGVGKATPESNEDVTAPDDDSQRATTPPSDGEPPRGALEIAERAFSFAAPRAGFPLLLLILVGLFLLFQNRLDSRDPKLALAPLRADTDLEFEHP